MGSAGPEARAERWLCVDVEVEQVSVVRKIVRGVRATVWEVFLDWLPSTPTLKIACEVIVRRRDTGAVLARYDYDNEPDARLHQASLAERLRTWSLFDLTRELGIAYESVQDAQPVEP